MSIKCLATAALAALCAVAAQAEVGLRIDSRPASEPIEAYVRVTDGTDSVAGLTAADFAVTLDGVPLTSFTLALPPRQDPAQKVSIVIVTSVFDQSSVAWEQLIRTLDPGDLVAIAISVPCLEMPRMSVVRTHSFTEIDHAAGSDSLIAFLYRPGADLNCSIGPSRNLSRGLELFATTLPAGPRALLAPRGGVSLDLSALVDLANLLGVSVFTGSAGEPGLANSTAAALVAVTDNTGGVHIEAADRIGDTGTIEAMLAWLKDGYRVTVPQASINDCNEHMLEVTVRGTSTSRSFGRCDVTPDELVFDYRYPVAPGSTVVSEPRAIASIEGPVAVTVVGGEFSIGCGSIFTSQPGVILPGETICLRHTAAATDDTTTVSYLITGGVSSYLTSLTTSAPPPPPPQPPDNAGSAGGGGSTGLLELLLVLAGLAWQRSTLRRGV